MNCHKWFRNLLLEELMISCQNIYPSSTNTFYSRGYHQCKKIYIIISLRLQKLKIDERYWVTTIKSYWDVEKLCNHPDLLDLPEDVEGSEEFIPDDYQSSIAGGSASRNREIQTWFSGKFLILERFLQKLIKKPMIKLF